MGPLANLGRQPACSFGNFHLSFLCTDIAIPRRDIATLPHLDELRESPTAHKRGVATHTLICNASDHSATPLVLCHLSPFAFPPPARFSAEEERQRQHAAACSGREKERAKASKGRLQLAPPHPPPRDFSSSATSKESELLVVISLGALRRRGLGERDLPRRASSCRCRRAHCLPAAQAQSPITLQSPNYCAVHCRQLTRQPPSHAVLCMAMA